MMMILDLSLKIGFVEEVDDGDCFGEEVEYCYGFLLWN